MVATGLTPNLFAQVRADAVHRSRSRPEVDHELLDLMRRSGCSTVTIGTEAITDEALAHVDGHQVVMAPAETTALQLPALRVYARRQLGVWRAQDRSRAHVELLVSLG